MASTPGRPSKAAKDKAQAERDQRDAERRAKAERQNKGKVSPRTIADAAEAANRRGKAEKQVEIESAKDRKKGRGR